MSSTLITIIIAAGVISVAVFIKNNMWPGIKKYFLNERLSAGAILLNVQQTGISINKEKQLILQLQVEPDMGKNFVTEIKGMFNDIEIAALQPGAKILVTYNPHYHKRTSLQRAGLITAASFSVKHNSN